MSRKTVEMTLQGNLLRHLDKDYSALVSAIETEWKEETTNFSETILRIIRHAEINKENAQDVAGNTKILPTVTLELPRRTCTTPKCVEKVVTTHYNDWCWIKNPELRAKYSLRQMKPRRSNRNLQKAASASVTVGTKRDASPLPELESWQPKVLSVEGICHNFWLIDSAADVHVFNDRFLMTEYYKKPTRFGGSKADGLSPGRRRIQLRLGLKDGSERMILNLRNVYYLPSSSCNLVSVGLLNDSRIFHDNRNQTLCQLGSNTVLANARW